MSIAVLIRRMSEAGAPAEAIALAVEEIEAVQACLDARRMADRDRKRAQREAQKAAIVAGHSGDGPKTVPPTPSPVQVSPQAPLPNSPIPDKFPLSPPKAKRCLLPSDWAVPLVDELPPRAKACAEQWTEDSYQTEGEGFSLYWRSERKMKTDWVGTWANWVIRQHSKVMRDQKFGNAPGSGADLFSSASGYQYRGDLESIRRQAEKRADWTTYYAVEKEIRTSHAH